ncbi:hypothetical protein [Methylobacterium sp. WSM2598]|uniref:hypothetical protein n=1 Tax=Methylobacterium sp. WSM2598 TaxID=398261 RepID=UPI0003768F64|nr:hypothetical protein [Methylobacterium sp. WSM2598]
MSFGPPERDAPQLFVRYDEAGNITGKGVMSAALIEAERQARGGIIAADGHWLTHYVDLTTDPPQVREKPSQGASNG